MASCWNRLGSCSFPKQLLALGSRGQAGVHRTRLSLLGRGAQAPLRLCSGGWEWGGIVPRGRERPGGRIWAGDGLLPQPALLDSWTEGIRTSREILGATWFHILGSLQLWHWGSWQDLGANTTGLPGLLLAPGPVTSAWCEGPQSLGDLSRFLLTFLTIQNCNISMLVGNEECSAQTGIKTHREPPPRSCRQDPRTLPRPPRPPLRQCPLPLASSPLRDPQLPRTQDASSRTPLLTITLSHPWGVLEPTWPWLGSSQPYLSRWAHGLTWDRGS